MLRGCERGEAVKALAIDLFCGLGGWAEGFLAEGFDVVGFDIERRPYPGQLVLQDVLTLDGAQFRDAAVIVASPPCQFFAYTSYPFGPAQKRAAMVRADPALLEKELALFRSCFCIQAEASAAAGRHIPLIVENVCGAQKWVGEAQARYGSYYLWGDIRRVGKKLVALIPGRPLSDGLIPLSTTSKRHNGFKSQGLNWSDRSKHGQDFTRVAAKQAVKATDHEYGTRGWFGPNGGTNVERNENGYAIKNGADWFGSGENCSLQRRYSSRSQARKHASALIAKIPFPLARHIARCYRQEVAA